MEFGATELKSGLRRCFDRFLEQCKSLAQSRTVFVCIAFFSSAVSLREREQRRRVPLSTLPSFLICNVCPHFRTVIPPPQPFLLSSSSFTQWCKFLSQEVRELCRAFVAPPREIPLYVCVTFTREFQTCTQE